MERGGNDRCYFGANWLGTRTESAREKLMCLEICTLPQSRTNCTFISRDLRRLDNSVVVEELHIEEEGMLAGEWRVGNGTLGQSHGIHGILVNSIVG